MMEKLNMQTTNIVDENIKRIGELFPNCLTERLNDEGKPEVAIDFDQLRQELSKDIVEGAEERYQFTWPDKRNAIRLANAPTTDTLRPCREESVDFDTTQNLYIEGDNLQVLKLLRENYLGKVKMIYIDPPYNTGNDFVYNDNFGMDASTWSDSSGDYDEEGNWLTDKYTINTESNGRFHTDWLNMIYPRLKVAKDLLSEDGVIFISIDDNEQKNLKNICDEVFGEVNFLGHLTIIIKPEGRRYGAFAKCHEFCLVYSKDSNFAITNEISVEGASYQYYDEDGGFNLKGLRNRNVKSFNSSNRPNLRYPFFANIQQPDKNGLFPVTTIENKELIKIEASVIDGLKSVWRWGKETAELKKDQLVAYKGPDGNYRIFQKERKLTQTAKTLWNETKFISNKGTKEVADILGKSIFDFPKSVAFVKQIIQIGTEEDSLILDFFSGSATTAHAVMQLNAEDGGKRKFVMVQLPEATNEESEAYKAGYKNICEIGKERIRRAGKKIKEDSPLTTQDLDTGFRVLKLDSSNMQDVYYTPSEFNEQKLFDDNIKPDRTEEDLLFQTMIDLGIELSAKIEKRSIAGKTVWSVSDGYLMACFDEDVNETTITEIARQQPYYFVMRDSSLANDQVADNFEQIWEEYSKDTVRRII